MLKSALSFSVLRRSASLMQVQSRDNSKYLPTSHLAKQVAGRKMDRWIKNDVKKRKKQQTRVYTEWTDTTFEDGHKVKQFERKLKMALAYAMLEPHLKCHFVGRGITLIKVKVDKDKMEDVTAMWTTTKGPEERDETEVLLEKHKDEIRAAMEVVADVGRVNKLSFERADGRKNLEETYDELRAREGTFLDEMNQASHAQTSESRLDEVLSMQKLTDTLGIDRQPIYDDLKRKLLRARAEHRVVTKPGLDEEPAKYATFDGGHFDDETKLGKLVKQYLGDKRKQEKEEKKVLKRMMQGEASSYNQADESLFK